MLSYRSGIILAWFKKKPLQEVLGGACNSRISIAIFPSNIFQLNARAILKQTLEKIFLSNFKSVTGIVDHYIHVILNCLIFFLHSFLLCFLYFDFISCLNSSVFVLEWQLPHMKYLKNVKQTDLAWSSTFDFTKMNPLSR